MGQLEVTGIKGKVSIDISDLKAAVGESKVAFGQISGEAKKSSVSLKQVGAGMTVAGAGIVAGLGGAVKSAATFSDAMGGIATLGVKDLGSLEKSIKSVSVDFGQDLVVSANAAYQAISAGEDAARVPETLAKAAKAATAGQTDLKTSIELGMGTMNAFKGSITDINQVFDQAFTAVADGVTTFEELAASTGQLAPQFVAAGLSSKEMFASIAALTKGGIKTTIAVTDLKAVVTNIIKPSSQAAEAAEKLGIKFDVATLKAKGLEGFLQMVKTATKGNVEEMGQLFGSAEALTAVLALTGSQAGDLSSTLSHMDQAVGATDKAFDAFTSTNPAFAFKQMKAAMQALAVEVGQVLLPILKDLIRDFLPAVQSTLEWMRAHEGLTKAIVVGTAAIGALFVTLGPILMVLPGLVTLFGGPVGLGLAGSVGAAGTALGGLAAAGGPIALVAAGVVALGAIIYESINTIQAWKNASNQAAAAAENEVRALDAVKKAGFESVDAYMASMKAKAQSAETTAASNAVIFDEAAAVGMSADAYKRKTQFIQEEMARIRESQATNEQWRKESAGLSEKAIEHINRETAKQRWAAEERHQAWLDSMKSAREGSAGIAQAHTSLQETATLTFSEIHKALMDGGSLEGVREKTKSDVNTIIGQYRTWESGARDSEGKLKQATDANLAAIQKALEQGMSLDDVAKKFEANIDKMIAAYAKFNNMQAQKAAAPQQAAQGQQPPGMASGGSLMSSRRVLVGEQGPEIVKLPGGAIVKTAEESRRAVAAYMARFAPRPGAGVRGGALSTGANGANVGMQFSGRAPAYSERPQGSRSIGTKNKDGSPGGGVVNVKFDSIINTPIDMEMIKRKIIEELKRYMSYGLAVG